MLTSFVLSMTLAAPVPAPAPPMVSGPAPRILELKADASGKVMVTVTRMEKIQIGGGAAINPAGAQPAVITREVARTQVVELNTVKDLTVTTADGKKVDTEDAIKKLATGGIVIVSTDGKPVSPNFLKLFKDEVLVLVSPELTGASVGGVNTGPGVKPFPGGGIRPLPVQPVPGIQIQPAPGIQILPGQPGVIQIQIAPAAPALPAPVPLPEK